MAGEFASVAKFGDRVARDSQKVCRFLQRDELFVWAQGDRFPGRERFCRMDQNFAKGIWQVYYLAIYDQFRLAPFREVLGGAGYVSVTVEQLSAIASPVRKKRSYSQLLAPFCLHR